MAEIPDHIRRIIGQYLTSLRDHGFQIEDAILFGSYASGQPNHRDFTPSNPLVKEILDTGIRVV